jgi:LytS/YehU family sensor histidine kinase
MLVQTLIENAVKHGISDLPQGGVVRLEARARDGMVTIVVVNSGPLRHETSESGLGLRNAAERLRLLYGSAASLTLHEQDGSTVARVTIPLDATA